MRKKFADEINRYLGSTNDAIFFYWKGRAALYAILKAMGLQQGDEVIMQAYTCVVVPNAVMYLGLKPVYVDIEPLTYTMDISQLEGAITKKTKAIICQNTYGLSSGLEEIAAVAKKHNLYTIEDCCHGFGGTYNGRPNGTYCDASFFSTQWNKPFSTGLGGFALVNNHSLLPGMQELESVKNTPSLKNTAMLSLLLFVRKYLVNEKTYWLMVKLYRWLSRYNLVLGSSQGTEITSIHMPGDYFLDMSMVQIKEGIKNIKRLDATMQRRKDAAELYTAYLKKRNKKYVDDFLVKNHCFLKYPLLVNDRKRFLHLAEKYEISLGDWFISPLHPVEGDLSPWGFNQKCFPAATDIASKMVNLPTDSNNVSKTISFLDKFIASIE